ncbi:heavy metal-binding protein HIP-like [Ruditapes philippinarum]|uniref:heavy metal-binding protein HIP-like n=1 Tax=Ruditapes philippinarum TaxID=129788 RepID=UPI00295C1D0D|nr:heavy metal-binding protein HIP-like [Ruditapes philippinarum]
MFLQKKYFIVWIVAIVIFSGQSKCDVEDLEPGQCLSKFDYDYKVMQKLFYLEKQIDELKKQKTSTGVTHVAFMAELSKDIVDPPADSRVVFDTVHTNVGDGYLAGPGVFIAPVDGAYCFNVVASSGNKSRSAHVSIFHIK